MSGCTFKFKRNQWQRASVLTLLAEVESVRTKQEEITGLFLHWLRCPEIHNQAKIPLDTTPQEIPSSRCHLFLWPSCCVNLATGRVEGRELHLLTQSMWSTRHSHLLRMMLWCGCCLGTVRSYFQHAACMQEMLHSVTSSSQLVSLILAAERAAVTVLPAHQSALVGSAALIMGCRPYVAGFARCNDAESRLWPRQLASGMRG